jgi:hypothetical protein
LWLIGRIRWFFYIEEFSYVALKYIDDDDDDREEDVCTGRGIRVKTTERRCLQNMIHRRVYQSASDFFSRQELKLERERSEQYQRVIPAC